jgi:hypothetical protein
MDKRKKQWQQHFIYQQEKKLQLGVITVRVFYACAIEERKREGRFNSDIFSLPSFFFNRCIGVCLFYSVIRKKIPITTYLARDFGSDFIPNTTSLLSCYTSFALCSFFCWLHILTVWWKRKKKEEEKSKNKNDYYR